MLFAAQSYIYAFYENETDAEFSLRGEGQVKASGKTYNLRVLLNFFGGEAERDAIAKFIFEFRRELSIATRIKCCSATTL